LNRQRQTSWSRLLGHAGINHSVLAALVAGWLLFVPILAWLLLFDGAGAFVRGGDQSARFAFTVLIIGVYLIGLGGTSLFCGLWGWAGLRAGNSGSVRRLNVRQIVAAVPGVLAGLVTLYLLVSYI
jgi:hypothetical protein